MAELFDFTIKNGAAGGFGMFSAAHFTWLAALVAAGSGVCLAYKNADENSRRIIRRAAAVFHVAPRPGKIEPAFIQPKRFHVIGKPGVNFLQQL